MVANSFWDFSVHHYAKPGVEQACLALQNEFGLDVNNVLFCLWHGRLHGVFSQSTLLQMVEFSNEWRTNIVSPLRSTRSWMKGRNSVIDATEDSFENLRNAIKKLELQAERLQQDQLQSMVSGLPEYEVDDPKQAMIYNLQNYLVVVDLHPEQKLMAHFEVVLSALERAGG
jgi:uncharacterized protein (TIGR02444 family)